MAARKGHAARSRDKPGRTDSNGYRSESRLKAESSALSNEEVIHMRVQMLSKQAAESMEEWDKVLGDNLKGPSVDSKDLVNVTPEWTKRLQMYTRVRDAAPASSHASLDSSLKQWYLKQVHGFVDAAASKVYVCWLNEATCVLFAGIFNGAVPAGAVFWNDNYYLVPSMSITSIKHQIESVSKQIISDIACDNQPKECIVCEKIIGEGGTSNNFDCQHCGAPLCLPCLIKLERVCPVCNEPEAIARMLNYNEKSNEFTERELELMRRHAF